MKQNLLMELRLWSTIRRAVVIALAIAFLVGSVGAVNAMTSNAKNSDKPNIVLVHGAWADGSSWSAVIKALQLKGYNVIAPQFPLTSTADDVARLRQVLAVQDGPTIVAGHSYGGQIMTSLGTDAPNVVGLVYIAAFGLDEGESIGGLLSHGPMPPALANLRIDAQGYAWIPQSDFVNHFASDVNPVSANVMYAVQQPANLGILGQVMGTPAWRSLPSWYMVAQNDEAIPPDAQRFFAQRMGATTVEIKSSHVPLVSRPESVANLIEQAAATVSSAP
ncbi:MAG TPA: alpha/beta hydrolase [Anaerolineales bacterium]|nr:alpha/beta hydrolase [Anaerolineales bacterium]